ncbi:MAG: carboxypeptidase-like regulatory domain-containing protein [Thermoplasmata archaeon]
MVGPATTVRCPACGTPLRVLLAPAPPTQWFPCAQCHAPVPVVVPRDPPPLYSWEVMPGLYRALPAPRIPRWRVRRLAAGALVGTAILAAVLAALFGYYAVLAPAPGEFSVSGTVQLAPASGGILPGSGAQVVATVESGATFTTIVGSGGTFSLLGLPAGGVALTITDAGYSPITVGVFVSTLYSSGNSGMIVQLTPGSATNSSTVALTPYPNLEQFVAAIGGGVVILGFVALLTGYAAALTLRSDRPAVGVVAGGAGLFAPVALAFLSLGSAFPILLEGSGALAILGAFALSIRAVQMAQTGPAPD